MNEADGSPVPPSQPPTTPPPASPVALPSTRRRKWLLWVIIAIVILAIVVVVAGYTQFLGARFAPGLAFRINGPDTLVAGQSAVISWDTSPENQARYPSEKIEFCRGRFFGERCVTLNPDTTNDGEALVFVPAISPGDGYLRLTARDKPAILGGQLQPSASGTRAVTIVAAGENTASTIGPTTVGGGIVGTISPTGPRVAAARGASHTVILPHPKVAKKVEVCRRDGLFEECRTLVSSATGGSATIQLPSNYPTGSAYLKVSERGSDGFLTGNVFYRRAIQVEATSQTAQNTADTTDSNDDDSGGDNNDSDSSSDSNQASTPTPTPTPAGLAQAQIIDPINGVTITGNTLTTSVKLTEPPGRTFSCHQWEIDGQILTPADWVGGNSPDQSSGPCVSASPYSPGTTPTPGPYSP